MFAPAAVAAEVAAVFVIPLTLGAIALGVLEICWYVDGPLSPEELADALLFADTATTLLRGRPTTPATLRRWGVVHQATGMVSVQMDTDLGGAFLRLRAHAYLAGRRLSEVSADVVTRKVRFTPDADHEKQR
ncbi:ANTAR domain-containing protein [Lentzea guizhouensis]|uniref:ANTAR domain-containing protein n=1 Tax=Lentzea guizhouensis TaxID=1586287 RepID=UPI0009F57BB9|nr:ANTAR domain-containing protein [Lentzea guizhouensis]